VSGSVWFQSEQISAVTDPGPEQFWPDFMNATFLRKTLKQCTKQLEEKDT